MQLTHYTDYGLRVLIFLSEQDATQRFTITEIADHFGIPRNHLVKVVHQLSTLKHVDATRGRNGGIRLGRHANEICVGNIIREMEATLDIVDCNKPGACPLLPECRLKGILNKASNAFLKTLDQYTIADLTSKARPC